MKKIAIIGYGTVGKAMGQAFPDAYIYDKRRGNKRKTNQSDLAIICVPTESKKDGGCDISIVDEVVSWLETPLIWIRSTIAPGTTEFLADKYKKRIVFSPEYVGESKYYNPIMKSELEVSFVILGGRPEDTQAVLDIIQPIYGPLKRYMQVSAKVAELAKYFENSFFAAKVALCNEFYDICGAHGVEWDLVRECWFADPRINPMHTSVFKDSRGFGGKCLVKDLRAIIASSKEQGFTPRILSLVDEINREYQKKKG